MIDFSQPDAIINRDMKKRIWGAGYNHFLDALDWGATDMEIVNGCLQEFYRVQSEGKPIFVGGIIRSVCGGYIRKERKRGFTFKSGRQVKGPPRGDHPYPDNSILSWDVLVEHAKETQLCESF